MPTPLRGSVRKATGDQRQLRYLRQPVRGGRFSGGRPMHADPPPKDGPGMVDGRIDYSQTEQVAPTPPTAAETWRATP